MTRSPGLAAALKAPTGLDAPAGRAAPDGPDPRDVLAALRDALPGRSVGVHEVPARAARRCDRPSWVDPVLAGALQGAGLDRPWSHQAEVADLLHGGRHTVVATGTASGKSLGYLLPVLSELGRGARSASGRAATALYLSPTKALAADQLERVSALALTGVRAATYDGDTPSDERRWIRAHANYVLTNPDLLHHSLLPGHEAWAPFLRRLRYVVVDECHAYRGVFGGHLAAVLRRLRRVCARYGAAPTFAFASATVADPGAHATRLLGLPVAAVTQDGSPHGATWVALWEPPEVATDGAPTRRSAGAETADLLVGLVRHGVQAVAFTRSRAGTELVANQARRALADIPGLATSVAAYRGGYLPEDRRLLERALREGTVCGLAATNALELGIDISGLDAVLIAGWPGTRASLWQQAGRAGRAGRDALAVFVAADDPLDTYLVRHPEAILGAPVEATVVDPENPHVLAGHLAAAAAELPLTSDDEAFFGPSTVPLADQLVRRGLLRRRATGWYWTRPDRPTDHVALRGTAAQVRIVENRTARVLGTVDEERADSAVHTGAVYVHQGQSYVVTHLDLDEGAAMVTAGDPGWYTQARGVSAFDVVSLARRHAQGPVTMSYGAVAVRRRVTSFLRRLPGGTVIGEHPLELPERTLRTKAVWWTVTAEALTDAGLAAADVPGAAHAAEHAAIGLLPLIATADRWDIGGVSTELHPDTGLPTIMVYDGHPGGAGFAERGFEAARRWLDATREAVAGCGCADGCPACVQSPKCGNGNNPLDKAGAVQLLDLLRAHLP